MAAWTTQDIPDQTGKLAIVTGATGGLGLETALDLVGAGVEVILVGRNPAKGADALALIQGRHREAKVRFEQVDLASLASVKAFAERILAEDRPIDILVNNAGVMALPTRQTTADGFEMQFGTNYLSHFALTARLLPLLAADHSREEGARVVQLSSMAHRGGRIRLEDLNYEGGYRPWAVYQQSKLAMLMFALELDRRSAAEGWGLTSVAAHPGFARTDLIANGPAVGGGLLAMGSAFLATFLSQSAAAGALPTLMAATMPRVSGGQYFGPQGWQEMKGPPGQGEIKPQAMDADVARRLWIASEGLAGIAF